jgi:micrococcal nuclease
MSHGNPALLRRGWMLLIAFIILILISLLYDMHRDATLAIMSGNARNGRESPIPRYYRVNRVVDGDTLLVDYNGAAEKVRLIGINTPETVDPRKPVECFGKEASIRMKEIAEGELVRLERDPSQNDRDVYGRILAYAYLQDGQMLNRKMIADGYAYEYTYMTPYRYQNEFKELQTLARTSERGLWGTDMCYVKN